MPTDAPMLSKRRRRELESLAYRVQPELAAAPLYLVGAPPDYPQGAVHAFRVSGNSDLLIFRALEGQIGWRGPGVVIVFTRKNPREKMRGTLLHELAHPGLCDAPTWPATDAAMTVQREIITEGFRELERMALVPGDQPRWATHHDMAFHRRALHLHWRAWAAGYAIGLPLVAIGGWQYDLSPAWQYRRALGNEPRRLAGKAIAEIDAIPAPDEFTALWNADTQRHQETTR